ncbi:hypothetical protein [Variovorax paradoxus]|uniref:Transcriptional regulator n=1 Tax=Variovorax paradoxus TaxID=34073 RepID=A0A0H2LY63_VARPD|nr:hypothetical protein [Variovorax paradoxus]KLN54711.1 hypothetical protein VPARA_40150 [Variovorax paradoxus]
MNASDVTTKAGRHIDHETLMLWVELVKAGGYHNLREVRRTWCAATEPGTVRERLARLCDNGMVRERRIGSKHTTYGVTTKCIAPPGYDFLMRAEA